MFKPDQLQRVTKVPYKNIWERDRIKKEIAEQNGYELMVV